MTENTYLRWLSGATRSIYWHDSAVMAELEEAIGNGAVGVTTNPFLVNATLRANPSDWRSRGVSAAGTSEGDARAEHLICQVAGHIAARVA